MKRFRAVSGKGHPIITVGADSEAEARERVEEQLNRPGRRQYLHQWRDGGGRLLCDGDDNVARTEVAFAKKGASDA